MLSRVAQADLKNGGLREATVAKAVDHPCLVKALTHVLVPDGPEPQNAGGRDIPGTAWLVMEFCNSGRLIVRLSRYKLICNLV